MDIETILSGFNTAYSLLVNSMDKFKANKKEKTDHVKSICENVSNCLFATADEIEQGKVPYGKCGEIQLYAQMLHVSVKQILGDAIATTLFDSLMQSYNVEKMAHDIMQHPDKEKYIGKIKESAGNFRGVVNMMP